MKGNQSDSTEDAEDDTLGIEAPFGEIWVVRDEEEEKCLRNEDLERRLRNEESGKNLRNKDAEECFRDEEVEKCSSGTYEKK